MSALEFNEKGVTLFKAGKFGGSRLEGGFGRW
jgi:hypothetical protein